MKKNFLAGLATGLFVFGMVGMANATLYDRGAGLIYDDYADITWLQDANYAQTSGYDADGLMVWAEAETWVEQLVYEGYDDWRLPVLRTDIDGWEILYPGSGVFITGSELGHMYYDNLGGSNQDFPNPTFTDGNGDSVSFRNLQTNPYWSGTELTDWELYSIYGDNYPEDYAWCFDFRNGSQPRNNMYSNLFAWAVRDGDVLPVPEPTTILLFGTGIAGLAGTRLRRKKK